MTKIALVHAVQAAMPPIEDAFKRLWPEARRTNLLDDSLTADREAAHGLTPELSERMMLLASYAAGTGADAVLFTCSAFGEAIDSAARKLPLPVLKPNEAMFEAALDAGNRIGMVATFAPAVESMEEEFRHMARRRGSVAKIETLVAPGARVALSSGDIAEHDRIVAETILRLTHCDAVMLAHFSTATAEDQARARAGGTIVLSAPASAIMKLKSLLDHPRSSAN
jgi:hypothetical protein